MIQGRSSHTTSTSRVGRTLVSGPLCGCRSQRRLDIQDDRICGQQALLPGVAVFGIVPRRRNSTFRFLRVVPSLPMKKFLAQITRGSGWAGCRPRTYSRPTLRCSANFDHRSGAAQARQALFTGGTTIPSLVLNVEPVDSMRLPNQNLMDVRVQKAFRLGEGRTLTGQINIFNATNAGTVTTRIVRSGPTFLRPTAIMLPRIVEFSATYTF